MKYIVLFNYNSKYYNFTLPELYSLCNLYGLENFRIDDNYSNDIKNEPYAEIHCDCIENEKLCTKIVDRALLTKTFIKVISEGTSLEEVISNIKKEDIIKEMDSEESFKIEVESRRFYLTQNQKIEVMKKLDIYPFKGKCNLENPERLFVIFQNFPEDLKKPYFCFGKVIPKQYTLEYKTYYAKFSLHNRKYIGPTTTDHILAFLMCNLAKIEKNQFIIDPFVGTGGMLIPASYFGGITYGCDIDNRVLKGYKVGYTRMKGKYIQKEEDIFSSFIAYNLDLPQIIRQDINLSFFKRRNLFFDVIICDPPYGYRAGTMSTGIKENKKEKREKRIKNKIEKNLGNIEIKNDEEEEEIGEKNEEEIEILDSNTVIVDGKKKLFLPVKQCTLIKIFENLIYFAEESLKLGGLLVCLYPHKIEDEDLNSAIYPLAFPKHENFKLEYACENRYSLKKSRWCLVYKKIK